MTFEEFERLRRVFGAGRSLADPLAGVSAGGSVSSAAPLGPAIPMAPALVASEHAAPGQTLVQTPTFVVPPPTPLPLRTRLVGPVPGGQGPPLNEMAQANLAFAAQQMYERNVRAAQEQQAGSLIAPQEPPQLPIGRTDLLNAARAVANPPDVNVGNLAGSAVIDLARLIPWGQPGAYKPPPAPVSTTGEETVPQALYPWYLAGSAAKHLAGYTPTDVQEAVKSGLGYVGEQSARPQGWNVLHLGGDIHAIANGEAGASYNPTWYAEHFSDQYFGVLDQLNASRHGNEFTPTTITDYAQDPNNLDEINRAFTQGYTVTDADGNTIAHFEPGGRAVWEQFAAHQGGFQKAASSQVTDPLNYPEIVAGGGGVLTDIGEQLALRGGRAWRTAGDIAKGVGAIAKAPEAIQNAPFKIPGMGLDYYRTRQAERAYEAARAAGRPFTETGKGLLAEMPAGVREDQVNALLEARAEQQYGLRHGGGSALPPSPPPAPPTGPTAPTAPTTPAAPQAGAMVGGQWVPFGPAPQPAAAAATGAQPAPAAAGAATIAQAAPAPTVILRQAGDPFGLYQTPDDRWHVVYGDGSATGYQGTRAQMENELNDVLAGRSQPSFRAGQFPQDQLDASFPENIPFQAPTEAPPESPIGPLPEEPPPAPTGMQSTTDAAAEYEAAPWGGTGETRDEFIARRSGTEPLPPGGALATPSAPGRRTQWERDASGTWVPYTGDAAPTVRIGETASRQPDGSWVIAQDENPETVLGRIYESTDWTSSTSDRNRLYETQYLRKFPPANDLEDRITNANLKSNRQYGDGQVTLTDLRTGETRTYTNTILKDLTPQERADVARLAVMQQQAQFERWSRMVLDADARGLNVAADARGAEDLARARRLGAQIQGQAPGAAGAAAAPVRPPSRLLHSGITDAVLPPAGVTYLDPASGQAVTLTNRDLVAMSPEQRRSIADEVVRQQEEAYTQATGQAPPAQQRTRQVPTPPGYEAPAAPTAAPEPTFRVEPIEGEPGQYLVYVRDSPDQPWKASAEGTLPDLRSRYGASQLKTGLEAGTVIAPLPAPGAYQATLFHGSPVNKLTTISAQVPTDQRAWENAAGELGAFFTPDEAEARYFGRDQNVYQADVTLDNAYSMSSADFGTQFGGAPGSEATRIKTQNARDFRARLEAEGYDGIVVYTPRGEVSEVVAFTDVPLSEAEVVHPADAQPTGAAAPPTEPEPAPAPTPAPPAAPPAAPTRGPAGFAPGTRFYQHPEVKSGPGMIRAYEPNPDGTFTLHTLVPGARGGGQWDEVKTVESVSQDVKRTSSKDRAKPITALGADTPEKGQPGAMRPPGRTGVWETAAPPSEVAAPPPEPATAPPVAAAPVAEAAPPPPAPTAPGVAPELHIAEQALTSEQDRLRVVIRQYPDNDAAIARQRQRVRDARETVRQIKDRLGTAEAFRGAPTPPNLSPELQAYGDELQTNLATAHESYAAAQADHAQATTDLNHLPSTASTKEKKAARQAVKDAQDRTDYWAEEVVTADAEQGDFADAIARGETAEYEAEGRQILAEQGAAPPPAVAPPSAEPTAPRERLPNVQSTDTDPFTGKPLAPSDLNLGPGMRNPYVHADGTLTPYGLQKRQDDFEAALAKERKQVATLRRQLPAGHKRLLQAEADLAQTEGIVADAQAQLDAALPQAAPSPEPATAAPTARAEPTAPPSPEQVVDWEGKPVDVELYTPTVREPTPFGSDHVGEVSANYPNPSAASGYTSYQVEVRGPRRGSYGKYQPPLKSEPVWSVVDMNGGPYGEVYDATTRKGTYRQPPGPLAENLTYQEAVARAKNYTEAKARAQGQGGRTVFGVTPPPADEGQIARRAELRVRAKGWARLSPEEQAELSRLDAEAKLNPAQRSRLADLRRREERLVERGPAAAGDQLELDAIRRDIDYLLTPPDERIKRPRPRARERQRGLFGAEPTAEAAAAVEPAAPIPGADSPSRQPVTGRTITSREQARAEMERLAQELDTMEEAGVGGLGPMNEARAAHRELVATVRSPSPLTTIRDLVQRVRDHITRMWDEAGRVGFLQPDVRRFMEQTGALRPTLSPEVAPKAGGDLLDTLYDNGALSERHHDLLSAHVEHEGQSKRIADVFDEIEDFVLQGHPGLAPDELEDEVVRRFLGYYYDKLAPKGATQTRLGQIWDAVNEYNRAAIMYNPVTGVRGIIGDALGDTYVSALAHGIGAPRAMNNPRVYMALRSGERLGDTAALENLSVVQSLHDLGIDLPRELTNVRNRADVAATGDLPLVRGLKKIPGVEGGVAKAAELGAGVVQSKLIRTWRGLADQTRRVGLFEYTVGKEFPAAANRFQRRLAEEAPKLGLNPEELWAEIQNVARTRVEAQGRSFTRRFTPEDVRVALNNKGVTDPGLARSWRAEVRNMDLTGRAAVNKTLFSYRQTKLDYQLGRFVLFNYWQSRALYLHGRMVFEHPALLSFYTKTYKGMANRAEKEGYPPSVRGYLAFMGDQGGAWSFLDPVGMLTPFNVFREAGGSQDARGWEKLMRTFHVFLNPQLQAAADMLGYGTSAVDPTSTYSVRNMAKAVINYDRNGPNILNLGPGVTDQDFVDRVTNGVFQTANKLARKAGLPFQEDLPERDPAATPIGQINNYILTAQEQKYGPMADWDTYDVVDPTTQMTRNPVKDEALEAETAVRLDQTDGNALATTALGQWSRRGLLQTGIKDIVPGGTRDVYNPTEQRRTLSNQGFTTLETGGTPSAAMQAAMTQEQIATAGSAEVAAARSQQGQYETLGTDEQQFLKDRWTAIANASLQPGETILVTGPTGPEVYSNDRLSRMTEGERRQLADIWVDRYGGTQATTDLQNLRTQQDVFRTGNPQIDAYKTWQGNAFDWADSHGGVAGFRKEMSRISPGYKQYINALPSTLTSAELDQKSVSLDAYEASRGEQLSLYGAKGGTPTDISQVDPSTFLFGGTGTAAASGGDDLSYFYDQLASYQEQKVLWDQAVSRYTGGQTVNSPFAKQALAAQLAPAGIFEPNVPGILQDYQQWATARQAQDQSLDVSPEAFIAWRQQFRAGVQSGYRGALPGTLPAATTPTAIEPPFPSYQPSYPYQYWQDPQYSQR